MDSPRARRCWLALFGAIAFAVAAPVKSEAQVFVYRLKMEEQEDKQLNFDFYERGYFIAPAAESGLGTFIFTADDGDGLKYYSVAQDSARYFFVRKRTERKAVIFSSSANGSANSVFMAVGKVGDQTFNFGGEIGRVAYAEELTGHVMAADDDSDPVYDDGSKATEGFAGISNMRFQLDTARTGDASRNSRSSAEVVALIVADLEAAGFEGEGASAEPTSGTRVGTSDGGEPIVSPEVIEDAGEGSVEPAFAPAAGFDGAGEIRGL